MHSPLADKEKFLEILLAHSGRRVVGYGAAAKAATFLCYCGVGPEWIQYIVDSTPEKIDKYMPGTRIPIKSPDVLEHDEPDVIIILAHNWTQEILGKIQNHIARGCEVYSDLERVA